MNRQLDHGQRVDSNLLDLAQRILGEQHHRRHVAQFLANVYDPADQAIGGLHALAGHEHGLDLLREYGLKCDFGAASTSLAIELGAGTSIQLGENSISGGAQ